MGVNWKALHWGEQDCSLWAGCERGCWLKRRVDGPVPGYLNDAPVLCRYRQIDEPTIYWSEEEAATANRRYEGLEWWRERDDTGREPGSRVTVSGKLRIIDIMGQMQVAGRPCMSGLRFVGHTQQPFLIAHFPGYSIIEHYPAMVTFQQAAIALPNNIAIVTFATQNAMGQALLLHQLDKAGIGYLNAASGITDLTGWDNTKKVTLLADVLAGIDSEYALVLDSLDVLLCGDLAPLIERFEAYDCKVLFGATKHEHPKFPIPGTREGDASLGAFSYINAGTAFGRTSDLLAFYQRAAQAREMSADYNERRSEQYVVRVAVASDPGAAEFDHRCTVFQVFGGVQVEQDGHQVRIY